jgi:hypothetical protein
MPLECICFARMPSWHRTHLCLPSTPLHPLSCDLDVRRAMFSDIVLSGGSTMFSGTSLRRPFTSASPGCCVAVHASPVPPASSEMLSAFRATPDAPRCVWPACRLRRSPAERGDQAGAQVHQNPDLGAAGANVRRARLCSLHCCLAVSDPGSCCFARISAWTGGSILASLVSRSLLACLSRLSSPPVPSVSRGSGDLQQDVGHQARVGELRPVCDLPVPSFLLLLVLQTSLSSCLAPTLHSKTF